MQPALYAQDSGDKDKVFQSIADEVNREINDRTGRQGRAFMKALEAADFVGLRSADDIIPRMEVIKRFYVASEDVIAVILAAPAKAFLKARERGLSLSDARALFEAMKTSLEGAKADLIVQKMQADREWARLNLEVYDLLNRERDKWRPATEGGMIDVKGDIKFKKRLIDLMDKIKETEERADAIQDRIRSERNAR